MQLNNIPFGITDWAEISQTRHEGEQGYALWRTQQFDNIRVRIVEYSKNYLALALSIKQCFISAHGVLKVIFYFA